MIQLHTVEGLNIIAFPVEENSEQIEMQDEHACVTYGRSFFAKLSIDVSDIDLRFFAPDPTLAILHRPQRARTRIGAGRSFE